jgi:hypothetical protein
MACVWASLFIDHLVDEAKTIRPLRRDLIAFPRPRVQKNIHHPGAHR